MPSVRSESKSRGELAGVFSPDCSNFDSIGWDKVGLIARDSVGWQVGVGCGDVILLIEFEHLGGHLNNLEC